MFAGLSVVVLRVFFVDRLRVVLFLLYIGGLHELDIYDGEFYIEGYCEDYGSIRGTDFFPKFVFDSF